MKKILSALLQNEFFLYVVIPFLIWLFCFQDFLSGRAPLTVDATSYYDHIGYFTDNIAQGVYPLWNSMWFDGSPYNFFLRRIGEVNPFYWIVVGLKLLKVPDLYAYLVFLASYYFLAVAGFWLIAKFLFRDRLASSAAFLLLLFSGWGSQIFFNYIIILFVPVVWFFYFLLTFAREGKKHQFFGMFFVMALVVTTYIPFFVLTVIGLALILFPVFFWKECTGFISLTFSFLRAHKIFAALCLAFLILACVPAADFYKESKQGEFVMPGRHAGATETSAVAVAMKRVKDGDILAQGYFDKTFMDHPRIVPGDFFISYFFFLACLITVITPLTRTAGFLLANTFILGVISMTETSPLYQFLYDHIFFFRYMRMMSYLFWIAVLPMAILLVIGQVRGFWDQYRGKGNRYILSFVVLVHVLFGAWALTRESVSWTAWLTVGLSLAFFTAVLIGKWNKNVLGVILAAAVMVQPFEMCYYLAQNAKTSPALPTELPATGGQKFEFQRTFSSNGETQGDKDVFLQQLQRGLYYASKWYADIFVYVPPKELEHFTSSKLYLFDNTLPYTGTSPEFFKKLSGYWQADTNLVLLPKDEVRPEDIRTSSQARPTPKAIKEGDPSVKVLSFDANTLSLKTNLAQPKFLLWTDNYHSGWHALINGKETRVLRANYAFKGIWLPAGESHVVFRFATPWRYLGAGFMLTIFASALGLLVFLARREGLFIGKEAVDEL